MDTPNANTLLSPEEAAARIKLSPATLNTWRSRGKGPRYAKLGGKIFYRLADLDDFITKSVVDPTHVAA